MENDCEVVGWVLLDDSAHVLVRKQSDSQSPALSTEKAFEHIAIQTGSFRRRRIIDSVTRRALVHQVE